MTIRFDSQADQFDQRAGLPADACSAIADAIREMVDDPPDSLLLEIGAGTGQIGQYLLRAMPRYVGFDLSSPMLNVFRSRLGPGDKVPTLVEADGNGPWPVADGSTDVIFSSRALHLLDRDQIVRETLRVAAARGACLIVGRVRRDPESVSAQMRRQMRRFLSKAGIEGRSGEKNCQAVFDELCARGGRRMEPRVAATWRSEHSPLESIESWQGKEGLAGVTVPNDIKYTVLERLRAWALDHFGDLRRSSAAEQSYVLEGVQIFPRPASLDRESIAAT